MEISKKETLESDQSNSSLENIIIKFKILIGAKNRGSSLLKPNKSSNEKDETFYKNFNINDIRAAVIKFFSFLARIRFIFYSFKVAKIRA